jgi:hypothetical protein
VHAGKISDVSRILVFLFCTAYLRTRVIVLNAVLFDRFALFWRRCTYILTHVVDPRKV